MKKFLTWLLRVVLGMLLLLLCTATIRCFFILPIFRSCPESLIWTLIGAVGGTLFFLHFRLTPIYVFGHELTHWLIAKIFRRKTSKFTVHFNSGSVRVENPNIWIVLGPYIFPIYMLLWLGAVGIASLFTVFSQNTHLVFSAIVGILYAYHLLMTIVALSHSQPDLKFNGVVFSMVFIITFNVLFLYLGVTIATQQAIPALQLLVNNILNLIELCMA